MGLDSKGGVQGALPPREVPYFQFASHLFENMSVVLNALRECLRQCFVAH